MIASLRGKILEIRATFFVLDVNGVGYHIKTPHATLLSLSSEDEAFLYIHDHIREDAHDLFGFLTFSELELFERLLSVSGVGPKAALTILSIGSAERVRQAIMQGELSLLTSVPGVGMKTAQKIILDLKGKLVEEVGAASGDDEVIAALVSLGYSAHAARTALQSVSSDIVDISARVRETLKYLAR